ncbi:elongation factor P [Candidatus Erwinia haradaeae]|uniref:Elongation factor P n=1 Tax=Candidatus Erwinia haradaeae TaxID=1922217 RepID=A0A803FTU0_9GAMM|nr:elongation factor P [Candidatus Erwinia haradaeae]VFP88235.1 Elongation factor P [Candidatus Erwinia haradaeae]
MVTYFSNDFRPGLKIIFEGEPYTIESSQFVKPGKGQAFVRVKMRRLLSGARIEKTLKAIESVESANIIETNLTYLYRDESYFYFMHSKNFEQYSIQKEIVGDKYKWLLKNIACTITLWNDIPIHLVLPKFVEIEIIDTSPSLKGDTSSTGSKTAILSTGARIKVPLFIQIGEIIKVDTRSNSYISRVK